MSESKSILPSAEDIITSHMGCPIKELEVNDNGVTKTVLLAMKEYGQQCIANALEIVAEDVRRQLKFSRLEEDLWGIPSKIRELKSDPRLKP